MSVKDPPAVTVHQSYESYYFVLKELNRDLTQKLETQTQRLELLSSQRMANENVLAKPVDARSINDATMYADEGDEVIQFYHWTSNSRADSGSLRAFLCTFKGHNTISALACVLGVWFYFMDTLHAVNYTFVLLYIQNHLEQFVYRPWHIILSRLSSGCWAGLWSSSLEGQSVVPANSSSGNEVLVYHNVSSFIYIFPFAQFWS